MNLDKKEFRRVWDSLINWAMDKSNSRIVRVNSMQALFELAKRNPSLLAAFNKVLLRMERENIPSVNARIRIIREWFKV